MNKRELILKTISNELAFWQVRIDNLNSLNLYDANLFSETSICDILNAIFNYELKNENPLQKNFPAIDLSDNYNRIAIQVTSTSDKSKIQSTLNKFFENDLHEKFDELFILILGKKQKSYTNLNVPSFFVFDKEKHILDFRDILRFINLLPTIKLEKIVMLLEREKIVKDVNKQNKSNAAKVKSNLVMKKRLHKDLLRNIKREEWQYVSYQPYSKFKYSKIIIRSVDDRCWPNVDIVGEDEDRMSSWFKGEVWDFYDNGIELVSHGGYAIFDENENWDILDWQGEDREKNDKYRKVTYFKFLRIPYEYIVDYDMEPDNYDGYPTMFVEYAKNGMPYEEILYGIMGKYDKEDTRKSRFTYYFDNEKKKKLV